MSKNNFLQAFKVSVPVLFGYLALGMGFGLLLVEDGYPFWLTPIMSIFMYAGAGQYVAIGLFAANANLGMIMITELLVNIRHIVYGLSLINKFHGCGKWKPYMIFALTDETYSLLTTTNVPEGANKASFYGTIALLDHIYWITGTTLGSVLGLILKSTTNIDLGGVDFALTALFTVLLIEQILNSKDFVPPLIGGATTVLCIILWKINILPNANSILLASLAAGIVMILLIKKDKSEQITQTEENDK